ncbi:hypothetical protein [Kordia sp.]|uniref:hypothetical protein n=1 Tax=Kordia sp. TaxID=1965332 RepID=UPI003B594B7D
MKKQNLKSLKLNKASISNFDTDSISGGNITWVNAECRTIACTDKNYACPQSRTPYNCPQSRFVKTCN